MDNRADLKILERFELKVSVQTDMKYRSGEKITTMDTGCPTGIYTERYLWWPPPSGQDTNNNIIII